MFDYVIDMLENKVAEIQQGVKYGLIKYSRYCKSYWENKIEELQQAIEVLKKAGEKNV